MIMLKSTHDRAMAAHAMTENGLLERIARLELQLKNATEMASLKSKTIIALEEDIAEQSSKIQTLSNLNARLERELRPFKAPRRRDDRGWYLSDAQIAAQQEQAAQYAAIANNTKQVSA